MGLERLLRDIYAAQFIFIPLQAKQQHRFAGRLALGLDPVGRASATVHSRIAVRRVRGVGQI